ncbi:MAG: hypothetical protein U1E23_01495 [Reyranellaceae bacterium]
MDKRRPRILIVEDDVLLAWVAWTGLERAAFEVIGVADGSGAVAAAVAGRPDLVIMDIDVIERATGRPGGGVAAAAAIHDRAGIRCLLTGCSRGQPPAWRAVADPAGWLSKPYGDSDLVAAVRTALEGRERQAHPLP